MRLEINLVSKGNVYSTLHTLLKRKRVIVPNNDQREILNAIFGFISENQDVFELAMANRDFLMLAQEPSTAKVMDLMSIKYLMNMSGLDITFYAIEETETVNPDVIQAGTYEYLLVDENSVLGGFVRSATRSVVNAEDLNRSAIYNKVYEQSGMFSTSVINEDTILKSSIKSLATSEKLIGTFSEATATYVDGVFDYLGRRIIAMIPQL